MVDMLFGVTKMDCGALETKKTLVARKLEYILQMMWKIHARHSLGNILTKSGMNQRTLLLLDQVIYTYSVTGQLLIAEADLSHCIYIYILANSGFLKNFLYQGGVKFTVSWVFEDLKFKISEGYDKNW